jgi:hypothetical protein
MILSPPFRLTIVDGFYLFLSLTFRINVNESVIFVNTVVDFFPRWIPSLIKVKKNSLTISISYAFCA